MCIKCYIPPQSFYICKPLTLMMLLSLIWGVLLTWCMTSHGLSSPPLHVFDSSPRGFHPVATAKCLSVAQVALETPSSAATAGWRGRAQLDYMFDSRCDKHIISLCVSSLTERHKTLFMWHFSDHRLDWVLEKRQFGESSPKIQNKKGCTFEVLEVILFVRLGDLNGGKAGAGALTLKQMVSPKMEGEKWRKECDGTMKSKRNALYL